jgi:hypothetical protein
MYIYIYLYIYICTYECTYINIHISKLGLGIRPKSASLKKKKKEIFEDDDVFFNDIVLETNQEEANDWRNFFKNGNLLNNKHDDMNIYNAYSNDYRYCISDVSCLRLSCCINAFIFLCSLLMPYWTSLCVLRRTCRQTSLYETLFHCNTQSKHHHIIGMIIQWINF